MGSGAKQARDRLKGWARWLGAALVAKAIVVFARVVTAPRGVWQGVAMGATFDGRVALDQVAVFFVIGGVKKQVVRRPRRRG